MRATLAGLGGFSLSYLAKRWIFHPLPLGRSDEKILNKVRAKAKRLLRHPELLQVHVHQGRVTLSGAVLSHEEDHLIMQVLSIRGVLRLKNSLRTIDLPKAEPGVAVIVTSHSSQWIEWAKGMGFVASGAFGAYVAIQLARRGWLGRRAVAPEPPKASEKSSRLSREAPLRAA